VRVGGGGCGWPWSTQAAPNKRQRPCPSLPAVRWTLGATGAIGVAERGAGEDEKYIFIGPKLAKTWLHFALDAKKIFQEASAINMAHSTVLL
jgi:hypothetical protein